MPERRDPASDWDRAGLARRLARPRGQLELFGATFAVAVVIGLVAASQRPFFERHIQEKHPAASTAAVELSLALENRPAGAQALSESQWDGLYHLYMAATDPPPRHLPAALAHADPERARSYLLRSWHAGSDAQRLRVLLFVRQAGDASLLDAVERASRRSRPASTEVTRATQQTRDSLAPPGGR